MNEIALMQDMSDTQRMMFQSEMHRRRKEYSTAMLLCFFLGGLGAHYFYLGQTGKAIASFLFWWTAIPGIIASILSHRSESWKTTRSASPSPASATSTTRAASTRSSPWAG